MTGDEIRAARERAGLTQDELGELVGVSGRTVSNWERGASSPRNKLAKVQEVLDAGAAVVEAAEVETVPLHDVSDASLLAEIARRFDATRSRRVGDGSEQGSAAPTNQAAVSAATDEEDSGGAVHYLVPPPAAESTAAYRTRNRDKEEEERSAKRGEEPQD